MLSSRALPARCGVRVGVFIRLISAADAGCGLPPVADAPGALFGSAVFMFWATAAVANRPIVAAATIGIRRIFISLTEALQQHFERVTREDIATRAVFPDHAAAVAYLATTDEGLAAGLPPFEGPREYAGATTVFLAR